MTLINLKDFMKKYNLKNDTMKESDLRSVYKYPIYPRDSKTYSDGWFVIINSGNLGGNHWVCFIVKDNKSCYLDCFERAPDKCLLE